MDIDTTQKNEFQDIIIILIKDAGPRCSSHPAAASQKESGLGMN